LKKGESSITLSKSQQNLFWRGAMELNDLKPIAEKLFHIMPQDDFQSKDASDLEVAVQGLEPVMNFRIW
jgi:hypothetical protein